ncbi:MAG: WG repeat-containing protein [Clostridia bacterium]|nr:WG repeat-containing protein [Clostridia bacterium]
MKKLLATLLCLVMIASVLVAFTSCGSSGSNGNSNLQDGIQNNDSNANDENNNQQTEEKEEVAISEEKGAALPAKLVANKISSIANTRILIYDGGYLYGEGDKIGISSFDGSVKSGAIYTSAKGMDNYFVVATQDVNIDANVPSSLNVFGLVDASGRVIVPCEYSSLSILNEKYVWVCSVTELTTDKESAVTYMSKNGTFSLYPKDDDYFYNGNWFIYNIETGEKLEGVTGTKPESPRAKGTILTYKNDAGTEIVVNEKGEALPEGAEVLANGNYVLDGKVYSSAGQEIFALKKNGFEISRATDDGKYYIASKYVNYESIYAVMDLTGKIVSAEFEKSIYVNGLIIENQDKVYNFKGEQIIDGEFDSVYYESCGGVDMYILKKDDSVTILDGAFNVIYQGETTDEIKLYTINAALEKKVGNDSFSYNYTEKDFTVDGYSSGFLVATCGKYPNYSLKELVSGSTLIEGSTSLTIKDETGVIYVIAETASGHDIYTVVAG